MKRPSLFRAWWTDTSTGTRIGRATRLELREAQRLWWKHRDLRERREIVAAPQVFDERPLEEVVADEWTQIGLDSLGEAS